MLLYYYTADTAPAAAVCVLVLLLKLEQYLLYSSTCRVVGELRFHGHVAVLPSKKTRVMKKRRVLAAVHLVCKGVQVEQVLDPSNPGSSL